MLARRFFPGATSVSGPKRRRAYVIGDVHGRLDLLNRLLEGIEAEIARDPRLKTSIVFVGDLVDRGPESAGVVERLRTYSPASASTHFIMGNHEEVMLRVLAGETDLLSSWLRFGGVQTLQSYGVDPDELAGMQPGEIVSRLKRAVPESHLDFIGGFSDSISFGDYLFVHAGIRPGVALAEQSQADLRWIRSPFLEDSTNHGFVVVHGHTITSEVEVTSNRIGIDTGAFYSGILTALAIDGRNRWLLQTTDDGTERLSLD